ncbi:hypothetical protein [Tepidibacillus marianensis]|uniref:hypothetical protein n=1 Tax=Tepidibacillus marianensis TaxID=3131995 RepID=UPI0030D5812B
MANIEKGTILTIEGPADRNGDLTMARVSPSQSSGLVSRPVVIPWHMRGASGNLKKGTEVVYVIFDDHTGQLLGRMDGEWFGVLRGDVAISGGLSVDNDIATKSITSVNTHVHGGVTSGSSNTSGPV